MSGDEMNDLAKATSAALDKRVDESVGYVLMLFRTEQDGELIYLSDCETEDMRVLLERFSAHLATLDAE